jgi:hypothetical protein
VLTRPARPPPMPPPSVGPRLLAATLTTLHKHDRKVSISLVEKEDIVQYNLYLILKTKKRDFIHLRRRNTKNEASFINVSFVLICTHYLFDYTSQQ